MQEASDLFYVVWTHSNLHYEIANTSWTYSMDSFSCYIILLSLISFIIITQVHIFITHNPLRPNYAFVYNLVYVLCNVYLSKYVYIYIYIHILYRAILFLFP